MSHLAKGFGGIPVLRDVSFALRPGQLTVLAGENGAGKSTLMKIVTGQLKADAGTVTLDGTELRHADPALARNLGVGIVPQELAPYPELSVYENLFVGRELRARTGLLDRREMASRARDMLEVFGVDVDPDQRIGNLSVALVHSSRSPKRRRGDPRSSSSTSQGHRSLSERSTRFTRWSTRSRTRAWPCSTRPTAWRRSKLADQVLVLRDGQLVLAQPLARTTPDGIVSAMIGRDLGHSSPSWRLPRTPSGSQSVASSSRRAARRSTSRSAPARSSTSEDSSERVGPRSLRRPSVSAARLAGRSPSTPAQSSAATRSRRSGPVLYSFPRTGRGSASC